MQTKYLVKAEVVKVATMAAKGGTIRITLDLPIMDSTERLTGAQNKTCAMDLNFNEQAIDTAAGQMGLFVEDERESEKGEDKEFFGA